MERITALFLIVNKFEQATASNKPFASLHEAYAVLLEEVDELWDEIKKKPAHRDQYAIRQEATQVGAMALRILTELVPEPEVTRHEG